jgi:RNA polymerase sigma-70 factor (sigma-E family)
VLEMALEKRRPPRLAVLYAEHAPAAARLAYLLVGDRHLAEDIVQEAFVRVAGRLWALRDPGAFNAYLRRTVLNLARGHMRKKERERRYLDQWAHSGRRPQEDPPDSAVRDELDRALGRLTMRQRTALVLRYYEDLSERQTAELLGCPVGTVKSLVARGLEALRAELGNSSGV